MQKAGAKIPPEFEGRIDEALMKKTQEYEADKTKFGFVSSIFGNIVTIAFVFGGMLNIYNSWAASLNLSFIAAGWLFFLLLIYAGEFISIPFSLYSTFKI
ncbi:MAG: M48 family peptidase, partial [Nitrospirae bacterium]|nr:M48 family peptidase [Nitrospirota bacterium]